MDVQGFLRSEDGAITVDWVIITASGVGIALAVMTLVSDGTRAKTEQLDAAMNAPSVISRVQGGFGYTPRDAGFYGEMLAGLGSLEAGDLDAMAAYLNGVDVEALDAETAGQVADMNQAIDIIYADSGTSRPTGTTYDAAALTRVSDELGYTPAVDVTG